MRWFWIIVVALGLTASVASADVPRGELVPLDWSRWEALPVFEGGRIMPLDTFARRMVREIAGREAPTLGPPETPADGPAAALFPNGRARKFSAAELVFSWLVEPALWEDVAFLPAANETLREEFLGLPRRGPGGERFVRAAPRGLDEAARFFERLDALRQRQQAAHAAGERFEPSGPDAAAAALNSAYRAYRTLTFDPDRPAVYRQAFVGQLEAALGPWRRELAPRLEAWRVQEKQDEQSELAEAIQRADEAVGRLVELLHADSFTLAEAQPPVAQLVESSAALARIFAAKRDRAFQAQSENASMLESGRAITNAMAAQTAQLARRAAALEVVLYENGHPMQPGEGTPRIVPALDAFALESARDPDTPASPWLSWPRLLIAPPESLAAYPAAKLVEVRRAFTRVKDAYLDRAHPDRPARFAEAMDRFVESVRALGEAVEPLRRRLPVAQPDVELLDATAYPPSEFGRLELRYNRLDPFRWAWALSAASLAVLALGIGRARGALFLVGAAVLSAGQIAALDGLYLRAAITRMVPVTNMYETVLFTGLTVALLGLWFALLPILWPGLEPAWRVTALPRWRRSRAAESAELPTMPLSTRGSTWWTVGRAVVLTLRMAILGAMVYLLGVADLGPQGRPIVSFDLSRLSPTIGSVVGHTALGLIGLLMVAWTLWFVPRAVLAALVGLVRVPVELARQGFGDPLGKAMARRWFLMAGAAVASLAYLVAYFAPGEVFQRDVGTGMTPVLRNNFWLALHVLVVTASYGAGALAWGLANVALCNYAFGRYGQTDAMGPSTPGTATYAARDRAPTICAALAGQIYRATQVAVLLLAAGTITGAIWADHAWGRYWGWDPKEIGALVSLLVYLVVLHGRWAGWMGPFALAVGAVAGATAILGTWYYVNFVFSGGLHSYGEGAGGVLSVSACLAANWLLTAVASIRYALESGPMPDAKP